MVIKPQSRVRDEAVRQATHDLGPFGETVAAAFFKIPREMFITSELSALAYDDRHLPSLEGHTLQPLSVTARMIAALEPTRTTRVLEIGTGVGYTAALLSTLVKEVHTIDRLPALADIAARNLEGLGIENVTCHVGNGGDGLAEFAPYDAILVSAGTLQIPPAIREQLAVRGRIVVPIGPHRGHQNLTRVTRMEEGFQEESLGDILFVMRIGDMLVDLGVASREDVDQAATKGRKTHKRLGAILEEKGKVEEADLYRALAAQRGLKFGTVESLIPTLNVNAVRSLPRSFLKHNRIIPVSEVGDMMTLATNDPDIAIPDLVTVLFPRKLEICLVSPSDFRRLWAVIDLKLSTRKEMSKKPILFTDEQVVKESAPDLDAYYVQLFETLLLDAIGERASDIHLEQFNENVRVRIRVDGDLRELPRYRLSSNDLIGLVNVIKIRSKLDISEHRLPQGGRVRLRISDRSFDLRVQTQPTLYAEHAVIRILPQDVRLLSIDDLGLAPRVADSYRKLLEQPSGLILVVGPTGSGKTTTLYAGLQILAKDLTRKVLTVEDPIEYAIDGVQQSAARPGIGFAFAHAMRAFVREDPDVILVGEIRDGETALEAIRASQTGHLVFSTLHCNDATDAIQRLFDLGMHANSISSELIAVLAQRLSRRICEACVSEAAADPILLKEIFPDGPPKGFNNFAGRGCSRCSGYGTFGRVACVEFLPATAEFRAAISRRPPLGELRKIALDSGMITMREAALDLVQRRLISLSELPYFMQSERLGPEER